MNFLASVSYTLWKHVFFLCLILSWNCCYCEDLLPALYPPNKSCVLGHSLRQRMGRPKFECRAPGRICGFRCCLWREEIALCNFAHSCNIFARILQESCTFFLHILFAHSLPHFLHFFIAFFLFIAFLFIFSFFCTRAKPRNDDQMG